MTELKLQNCRLDGRYDLRECLGRGSYAEIYVAHDLAASDGARATVVIKALNVLLQGVPDAELEHTLVENFQNEAIALDRVRHPNIISRLGHGTAIDLAETTFHYLVVEYLPGGDMAALCRQHPLTLESALFYLEQVCSGLAHAHEMGVIHRDIKPQNLLLTEDRQTVKIADFGVAKLEATEGAITRVGTNIYAAPEHHPLVHTGPLDPTLLQATPARTLTPAADIYSLAKTTYALLAGEPPRRFSHRPITELPPSLTDKVWAPSVLRVLERATQTRPADRYQTVQQFWAELADAALPPTRLLDPLEETEVRPAPSVELTDRARAFPTAPPRPQFGRAPALEQTRAQLAGAARPRIVVPVAAAAGVGSAPDHSEMARRPPPAGAEMLRPEPPRNGLDSSRSAAGGANFSTRLLVAALLILAFAGMLFAFYSYVRSRSSAQSSAPTASAPASVAGHEGTIVNFDVKLRPEPSTDNQEVGIAERGSRVRVLSSNNNWYEVQVIQHGREKDDPASADRGWINKKYLKLD